MADEVDKNFFGKGRAAIHFQRNFADVDVHVAIDVDMSESCQSHVRVMSVMSESIRVMSDSCQIYVRVTSESCLSHCEVII